MQKLTGQSVWNAIVIPSQASASASRAARASPLQRPEVKALRRRRRPDHQREHQQHPDDLRAGRHSQRHDGEESGGDETQRHALGLRQLRLQAGKDQRPHDGAERDQRHGTERGERDDGVAVDRQHVAEQDRRRLRRERRVVVQEQEPEAERQRQYDADGDVAIADAFRERAHGDTGSEREADQSPQRREADQSGAGRAGKADMRERVAGKGLPAHHQEKADQPGDHRDNASGLKGIDHEFVLKHLSLSSFPSAPSRNDPFQWW